MPDEVEAKERGPEARDKAAPGREPGAGAARPTAGRAVLVTGATSPLARELVHVLYHDPGMRYVMAVSRDAKPYYFGDFQPGRFRFVQCDILRHRDLEALFLSPEIRDAAIDTVVHMAFRRRPANGREEDRAHRMNVDGTKRLLDRVLKSETVKKFVFLSSALVYKLSADAPVRLSEDADLDFSTDSPPFVRDRVDAEMIVRSAMDNGRVRIVILRPASVVGRNIDGQLNLLFESFLVAAPLGFDPLINPIHTNDVVKGVRLSIERDVQGVFNIAGPDTAPLSEFLRMTGRPTIPLPQMLQTPFWGLQRILGLTRYDPDCAPEFPAFARQLDIRKAREVLGFEPEYHIKFRPKEAVDG